MSNAKKAKAASIIDDEDALVDKIAEDIVPSGTERTNVKAAPASASEAPNGLPSMGPDKEIGMTAVVDSSLAQEGDTEVLMVKDGNELAVAAGDVKIHERSGWKRVKEEEV